MRKDALDTIVDEMLQAGSVVSNSENSPWIDETHEEIRSDLRGTKLYVSEQTWRDFRKDEARTLREQAREAGITLSKNPNDTAAGVRNMELAEKYGEELFPTDISASDMLRNIVDRAAQGVSEKQTLADRLWDEARLEGAGRDQQEAYDRMVGDLRNQTEVILREFAEDNHLTLREQTKQGAKSAEETSEAAAYEEAGTPTKKRDFRPISAVGEYTQQLAKMESTLETENSAVINEGKNRYEARITEEDDSVYAYVYKNGDLIAKARGMNRKKATHWIANQIRSDFGERTVFHPGLEGRGDYNADLEAAKRAEFPVLTKKNGEEVQAVPFWTWVRNKDRGNYGLVVGVGNAIGPDLQNLVEVYYYSKKTGTGKIVPESGLSV